MIMPNGMKRLVKPLAAVVALAAFPGAAASACELQYQAGQKVTVNPGSSGNKGDVPYTGIVIDIPRGRTEKACEYLVQPSDTRRLPVYVAETHLSPGGSR
jgi:hypothetical protein